MYIYIYKYMYIYIHTYIHTYMYIHKYTAVSGHIYSSTRTHYSNMKHEASDTLPYLCMYIYTYLTHAATLEGRNRCQ